MANDTPRVSDNLHPKTIEQATAEVIAIELNAMSGDKNLVAEATQAINNMSRSERQLVFGQAQKMDLQLAQLGASYDDPTGSALPHVKLDFDGSGSVTTIEFDGRGSDKGKHVAMQLSPEKSKGDSDQAGLADQQLRQQAGLEPKGYNWNYSKMCDSWSDQEESESVSISKPLETALAVGLTAVYTPFAAAAYGLGVPIEYARGDKLGQYEAEKNFRDAALGLINEVPAGAYCAARQLIIGR